MASKRFQVLALALLWSSVNAMAQDAAPAAAADPAVAPPTAAAPIDQPRPLNNPGGATLGDLDRIQGEILLAEAKAKLADARLALAKAEGSSTDLDHAGPPVVAGVFGPVDRPYARFLLADGSQLIGRDGDALSGGYHVVRVGVDKVVIRDRKGREIVARFSGSVPSAINSAPASSANNRTTSAER